MLRESIVGERQRKPRADWIVRSQQVGVNPKPENYIFLPVPCSIKYHLTEKAGRKSPPPPRSLTLTHVTLSHPAVDLLVPNQQSTTPTISVPPLQILAQSLQTLTEQITQIQGYVGQFTSGSSNTSASDIEVGKYLLDAVGRWKAETAAASATDDAAAAAGEGDDDDEEGVKKGLQDALSVSYLSALVRSQVELSARLNLLA